MVQIIINEWKMLTRQKRMVYTTLFLILSVVLVTWLGIIQNNTQTELQKTAQNHVRQQWENLEAMNPHGAAHYGSYAFKPITLLSTIDEGINGITGNVLRLEGHVQNEIVYSEASQSLTLSKFGKLKPDLLLKYVIPMLMIFLAFISVSREKETGRLKLIVLQGGSVVKLIFAKALSIWIYGLLFLIITIATQIFFNLRSFDTDTLQRTLLLLLSYAMYYYIIATFTTYLSARLKNNTAALSSILSIWILWTVFIPKIWGNISEQIDPLPNRQEFHTAMQEDRSKGIDGHHPSEERESELKNKVLAEYKVDSLEQLSINFDGILMQADEEYGNQVWDKHFGNNDELLKKQKSTYQLSGLFNPFAALQSLSMGGSGSDMIHHLDFLKQAELYRRDLIKTLNDKHAYGGSKTGEWGWTVDQEFFSSVKDFSYQSPDISVVLRYYTIDLFCLLFWIVLTSSLIVFTTKKVKLG